LPLALLDYVVADVRDYAQAAQMMIAQIATV